MHPQVVEDQEHLLVGVLDQGFQKLDQPVGVEGLVNDHPTRFALMGHRGQHG